MAVYEEMRMSEKNHHAPPTMRPLSDLGVMSVPCCMKAPRANQRLLITENEFSTVVPPREPSIFHSFGENLYEEGKREMIDET